MKTSLPLLIVLATALTGCATAPLPEYSWYHPDGGEYLFAFDASECEAQVVARGLQLGTDTTGPFFSCMEDRGYLLVIGRLRTVAGSPVGDAGVSLNQR